MSQQLWFVLASSLLAAPRHCFHPIVLAALLLASPLLTACARALDVDQVQWGFDGQVVANRFNLLSVLVSNRSSDPFDGRVTLRKSMQAKWVDAPLVEAVFLAPHTSRWIQFYPYSMSDWEEWSVLWDGVSPGDYKLPKPRQGKPGCVLLEEQDALASSGGAAIKRFPENLFPAYLTATDGLASVVLDHVPRWEESRQKAFIDWLRHGGRVHVLQNLRGEFPRFGGALQPLNTTGFRQRVGGGYVFHHDRTRRDLDAAYVEKVIVPGRTPAEVAAAASAATVEAARKPETDAVTQFYPFPWEGEETLLTALKRMVRPRHSWFVIHLMSWVYIAMIYPGCLMIGRRRKGDYRWVFGALLVNVAAFSLAFLIVGRRGYGERTSLHSLAVARVMPDGRCDVAQWSNAFAVDGGDYDFSHDGTGRMYSTCQDDEAVRGEITTGAEARFTADMPPFSSRAFGQRLVSAAPAIAARIADWQTRVETRTETVTLRDLTEATLPPRAERTLQRLSIVKGPNFPVAYQELNAVYGRRVYGLTDTADRLELKSEIGSMTLFLQLDRYEQFVPAFDELEAGRTPRELYGALFRPLFARTFNIASHRDALDFAWPEDRVRLLVYAPMPREFYVRNDRFSSQQGYVLYCLDLFPPEEDGTASDGTRNE